MSTTVKLVKPSIEQRKYDEFMRKFKDGKFGSQRLGQAFFNEFNLHEVDDQASLHNLHAKDVNMRLIPSSKFLISIKPLSR